MRFFFDGDGGKPLLYLYNFPSGFSHPSGFCRIENASKSIGPSKFPERTIGKQNSLNFCPFQRHISDHLPSSGPLRCTNAAGCCIIFSMHFARCSAFAIRCRSSASKSLHRCALFLRRHIEICAHGSIGWKFVVSAERLQEGTDRSVGW